MADAKEIKKIFPLVACEIPFCQVCLQVGVWCRHI